MMTRDENLLRVWELLHPIRYFAKSQGALHGGWCKTYRSFARTVQNLVNWDFYVTLNPSMGLGVKAKSAEVSHWSRILIDIDPVTPDALPPYACGLVCGLLMRRFDDIGSSMTVIDSGRGYQVWIELEPLPIASREQARRIERSISKLYQSVAPEGGGCRIDTSCSDLGRVARCPGTLNTKSGRLAEILTRYSAWPLTPFSPRRILDAFPPEEDLHTPIVGPVPHKGIIPYLSERAANFFTDGVTEPGRHAAAYALAASLRELGVPREEALSMVVSGGSLCRPPLSDMECARATRNAYEKEIA